MYETDLNPTHPSSEPAEGLEAAALRAQAWYGEPFLHPGEDPAAALAPRTARRGALDDAVAEMDAGRRDAVHALARPLRPHARPRARARGADPRDGRRHRAPAPPGRRAGGHADRADRVEPARRGGERERQRERRRGGRRATDPPSSTRRTTTSTRASSTTRPTSRRSPATTRAPRGATASATRPPRARRSPQPGSSSRRGTSAS